MNCDWMTLLAAGGLALAPGLARAGGSGLNTAIVVNQRSANSIQLGNYYAEQRQVPPENLLRIQWAGGNTEWSKANYESVLLQPLREMLARRGLSNQVETVVLSMDIPYRVVHSGGATNTGRNSTTSVLFHGFQPDGEVPVAGVPTSCSLPDASANRYAGSELPFRNVTNGSAWLTFMVTGTNLAAAKAIVDRGVVSDGTFPTQSVVLTKNLDPHRNVRYVLFDDAVFDARLIERGRIVRAEMACINPCAITFPNLLGYQGGHANFGILPNSFVPGAMADSLTSFGGSILVSNNNQTTLLEFLNAGATASYGTIVEPCNWLQKFPSPRAYFYQARGFSIAESYYQSLAHPFQGLLVGEPLAAPFARKAGGDWLDLPEGAVLTGITNLALQIAAPDDARPVQQVDLFLDGRLFQTLTNVAPQPGNILSVTLAGHEVSCAVPENATLASLASDLADALNVAANTNATRVRAIARGDRIELQSFEVGRPGEAISLAAQSSSGDAAARTAFLTPAHTNFLSTVARGRRVFAVTEAVQAGSYLQLVVTKTNGSSVTLSVTNSPGNTNTHTLVQALVNAVNANTNLTEPDGLVAEDFISFQSQPGAEFNLCPRVAGWSEAQITATLTGSAELTITPEETRALDENSADLMPRNHLYLTAGLTNLQLTFAFDTTALADGFHELSAVAYEGSHVRTQTRVARRVCFTNSPLAATLATLVGGSQTLVTANLQFALAANPSDVSRLELFSTGGLLAAVTNQSSATFAVAGTNLGVGLHPVWALVTRGDGRQYRTETSLIRLVGSDFAEPPFKLSAHGSPPILAWPAIAGRRYEVLSTTNPATVFQVRTNFAATHSLATWGESSNPGITGHFYRVRSVP